MKEFNESEHSFYHDDRLIKARKVIIRSVRAASSPNHSTETYYLYAENTDDPNFTRWIKGRIWTITWKIDPKSLIGKRVIINGWFVIKRRYTYIHSIILNGEETFEHFKPLDRFKLSIENKLYLSSTNNKTPEEEQIDAILSNIKNE